MSACGYCGMDNDNSASVCIKCGTSLELPQMPPIKTGSTATRPKKLRRELNAASATIILLANLVAQAFTVIFIAFVAFAIARSGGVWNVDSFFTELSKLMPVVLVLAPIMSGLATILTSLLLIPKSLKDTSPNGAAWVRGSWTALAQGFAIGLFVGSFNSVLSKMLNTHVHDQNVSALTRMALTPGLPRLLCALTVLLIVPPAEELLFRGALYGGYRKSFGPIWAIVLTTSLFLLVHLPDMTHPIPTVVSVIGEAAAALWCRLRAAAIGPAIAVHVGCNSWSIFLVVFR